MNPTVSYDIYIRNDGSQLKIPTKFMSVAGTIFEVDPLLCLLSQTL